MDPLSTVTAAKTAAMDLRMGATCGQDERWGCHVNRGKKN